MKLIHRHRDQQRGRSRRIAITQAEITADLHYPAAAADSQAAAAARRSARP